MSSSGFGCYGDLEQELDPFGFEACDYFWVKVGIVSDLEQNKYNVSQFMKVSRTNQKKIENKKRSNRLTRAWLFKIMWKYGKYKPAYKRFPIYVLRAIVKKYINDCKQKKYSR